MTSIKCFHKLHIHQCLIFANIKTECVYSQSTLVALNSFVGISFINALGESVHKVFQQFLQNYITQATHNTFALESYKKYLKRSSFLVHSWAFSLKMY